MARLALGAVLFLLCSFPVFAEEPFEGRTLISPINSDDTFLIDMDGTVLHTWHGATRPASFAYLLADGSILRPCNDPTGHFQAGGSGGRVQRIDADDTVTWDFLFSTLEYKQHHDIAPMPNGHVLLIAWEKKTLAEAQAAGRVTIRGQMWPTLLVEVEPAGTTGGNIVWEWHAWDHLIQDVDPAKPNYGVVSDHPELLDINYGDIGGGAVGLPDNGDWLHENAIDYNPELDQILFSCRTTNEFYILDHSTTTEAAAGHSGGRSGMGGDILYRWGNPQVYGRGSASDQYFYVIHGANWIDAGLPGEGNILALNNGDRPGSANDYSSAVEIVPPLEEQGRYHLAPGSAFGPSAPVWTYGGPGGFYAWPTQGGAYRLPNGNTLVCVAEGGYLFEVSESGTVLWDYDCPVGNVARALRYWDDLTAILSPEGSLSPTRSELSVCPNPFNPLTTVDFSVPSEERVTLEVFGVSGRRVATLADGRYAPGRHSATWNGEDNAGNAAASGIYFVRMKAGDLSVMEKMVLLR